MEQKTDFRKTWLTLLSIAACLFLVVGCAMIFMDDKYVGGSQYLMTSIIYSIAIFLITKNKIKPNYSHPMFSLGFIFSTIGLTSAFASSIYIGMWALGIVLFLSGLFDGKNI